MVIALCHSRSVASEALVTVRSRKDKEGGILGDTVGGGSTPKWLLSTADLTHNYDRALSQKDTMFDTSGVIHV